MVLSDDGEDTVLRCDVTGYAANAERCEALPAPAEDPDAVVPPMEPAATPGATSIEQVSAFLNVPPTRLIKTMIVDRAGRRAGRCAGARGPGTERGETGEVSGRPVAAGRRGDRGARHRRPRRLRRPGRPAAARAGDRRPGSSDGARRRCRARTPPTRTWSTSCRAGTSPCRSWPTCEPPWRAMSAPPTPTGRLYEQRGIEVGHVFNFGTKYSAAMGATFNDEDGAVKPLCRRLLRRRRVPDDGGGH